MSNGLTAEWDDYPAAFREDAHQLLAWGYADTRHKLPKTKDEYEITGLIAGAMDERIANSQTHERFNLYSIHNERPKSPAGELGKSRPKLDIQIEQCGIRPKRHFTFEAKRLRDDDIASVADTMTHYLGDDGVRRFIAGRYAAESVEAAMLGCIQAHDAGFWFQQVELRFAYDIASQQNAFHLLGSIRAIRVIADLPNEGLSVHERTDLAPIRLFHIFIDCR